MSAAMREVARLIERIEAGDNEGAVETDIGIALDGFAWREVASLKERVLCRRLPDGGWHMWSPVPPYLRSIDAAVTLAERVLPGCLWEVSNYGTATLAPPEIEHESQEVHAETKEWPPRPGAALVLAILRAKLAERGE